MPEVKPIILSASGEMSEIGAGDTIPASALPVSVITPSQITSDQDDYSPTGFSTATVVRLSGDNGLRAITGLSAGSGGDEKTLVNIGSYALYFPGEHPDSTAANRISAGEDVILMPGQRAKALYDSTLSRWQIWVEGNASNNGRRIDYQYSPGSVTPNDWGFVGWSTAGSGTTSVAAAGTPSVGLAAAGLSSAASATGAACIYIPKSSATMGEFGTNHNYVTSLVSLEDLSTSTQRYTAQVSITGVNSTASLNDNQSLGIRYSDDVNSGNWQLFTRNSSGTETTADSGVTVAADTPYLLGVFLDKSNSEARYYINNVMVGRITTNLGNSGNGLGFKAVIVKSVGTTARLFYVHNARTGAINP